MANPIHYSCALVSSYPSGLLFNLLRGGAIIFLKNIDFVGLFAFISRLVNLFLLLSTLMRRLICPFVVCLCPRGLLFSFVFLYLTNVLLLSRIIRILPY